MFKVRQTAQSTVKNCLTQNKTFVASASSRFQKAFNHDFTIKVSFPVEDIAKFKSTISSKGKGQEVENHTFETTYFDSAPKKFHLKEDALVPQGEKFELYTLSKKDIWLRKLNDVWICDSPHRDADGQTHLDEIVFDRIPHYERHEGEKEIRRELNLQQDMTREAREGIKLPTLAEDLKVRMAVVPYAQFKYTHTIFNLPEHMVCDLYATDFGYSMAEIQSIVKNGTDLDLTNRGLALESYLESIGVDMSEHPFTKTMILEWIARNNPEHYQALMDAQVVPDLAKFEQYLIDHPEQEEQ